MSKYTPTVQSALELHQKGDYDNAKLLYVKALEENAYDAQALQLLGVLLFIEKEYEPAIQLIKNAISIDSNIYEAHNNLGLIYQEINEYSLALASYKNAIHINPKKALTHNNIGTVYKTMKNYDLALMHYESAIKSEPAYLDAYINLANLHYSNDKYEESEAICKKLIGLKSYPININITLSVSLQILDKIDESLVYLKEYLNYDLTRPEVQITLSIYSWIAGDVSACRSYLQAITQTQFDDKNLIDRFVIAYKIFLEQLIQYKEGNSSLYTQDQELPVLYVIGDSHCLSYANCKVSYLNQTYRVESKIIMGCKAWHLSSEKDNKYKQQFRNIISNLHNDSKVLVVFGEIDCRLDDGILKHNNKITSDLDESVPAFVSTYVNYVLDTCQLKGIKPIFSSVPAPLFKATISTDGKNQLKKVIGLFNMTLDSLLSKDRIYDTFAVTVNSNGESNQNYHIDKWHLTPETITNL